MKADDIKKLYKVTPELHDSIEQTLRQLNEASTKRYRKRRNIRRAAVSFAVAALLAAFTTVSYATKLFGTLKTERIGRYGFNFQITATPDSSENNTHVKPDPEYLPKGFRQIIDKADFYAPEGAVIYDPYGNYTYTDGTDNYVHFFVKDASEFQEEGTYIVDCTEHWFNGHKTVLCTKQYKDNGEKYYFAIEYFEDTGYVVVCECNSKTELQKIMEHLKLQEADDYTEPVTIDFGDDKTADYAVTVKNERVSRPFGKAFIWTPYSYYQHNEYSILVKSIKEVDGSNGLDRENFFAPSDDDEWYSRFFNSDGSLKTPYIRTSYGEGDGIDTIGHIEEKEVERHFYLVTVEASAYGDTKEKFNSQFMTDGYGGVIYQETHYKNGTETIILGVVADGDELDKLALLLNSMELTIDDKKKTVVRREIETVIPLPAGQ